MSCKILKFALVCFSVIICLCVSSVARGQAVNSEITTSLKLGDNTFSIELISDELLSNRYVVKLNNRNVTVIEDKFVSVEGYFNLIDLKQIVILSRANGGNACPKELLIVAFDDEGLTTITPEFGNCSEAPTFIVKTDSITINFPYGKIAVSESWVYDKYGLRQTKKAQSKRKK